MKKSEPVLLYLLFLFFGQMHGQQPDWVSLPATTNASVSCLTSYNGKMIACGAFDMAGTVPVNKIAAWDGMTWSALGNGIQGKNIRLNKTYVFNNDLYAVGNFDSAGAVSAKDIAKWDGNNWSALGSGSDSMVYCMAIYNNELYAAGHFSTMGGVAVKNIAKWNGNSWQAVGGGIKGKSVRDLCVFQNELYAVGEIDFINNNSSCKYMGIVKWNGTVWDTVSPAAQNIQSHSGPDLVMGVWNNKLYVHEYAISSFLMVSSILTWDGISWSAAGSMGYFRTFLVYDNCLYKAGSGIHKTCLAYGDYVGIFSIKSNVWSLCEYNGELYCGGSFNKSNGAYHDYIARFGDVTGMNENQVQLVGSVFPNPVDDKLNLKFDQSQLLSKLSIINAIGQLVFETNEVKSEIDVSFLKPGVYYLKAESDKRQTSLKIIKE